jgi:lipid II:glycine glycyltransferase (peptidoglycan interpeptide bridge formation enzyme)
VIVREKAFYYYAAATERGRQGYFSNALVWRLLEELHRRNVTELDMSGIDPRANWGGYHFKRGVGGRLVAYTGEWDYSQPRALKPLIAAGLFWRTARLYK